MQWRTRWWVGAAVLALACGPRAGDGGPDARGSGAVSSPGALTASLEVEPREGVVELRLHVTNLSEAPVELTFPSAQRFDFVVRRAGGGEVWRWSADRSFAQMLGREVLEPGETLEYAVAWEPTASQPGTLVAVGRLTSNRTIEQSMEFELE